MSDSTEDTELRLYCVMRADLNQVAIEKPIPLGKLMAQAGHAYVGCLSNCTEAEISAYMSNGAQPKICLRAKTEHELLRAKGECDQLSIPTYLVTDAGRTVFGGPTVTCLGIGPVAKKDLPKFVQRLQTMARMTRMVPDDSLSKDALKEAMGFLDGRGLSDETKEHMTRILTQILVKWHQDGLNG